MSNFDATAAIANLSVELLQSNRTITAVREGLGQIGQVVQQLVEGHNRLAKQLEEQRTIIEKLSVNNVV